MNYFENPPSPVPLAAVPRGEWPLWARMIARNAVQADVGVGDIVHRLLGKYGEAFKASLAFAGVPCGCDARREEWNTLYPLKG